MRLDRILFAALLAALGANAADAGERVTQIPPPALDNPLAAGEPQTAVLAGGCYWGMQAVFEHVKGVQQVIAGFTGRRSSSQDDGIITRGHVPAESVQITFDPARISYGQILQIYFSVAHDPTQLNRQGPDDGPQYRSDVFYGDSSQEKIAEAYIAQLDGAHLYPSSIATSVDRLTDFHAVPDPQQDYVRRNPTLPYVTSVDLPKLAALKILFPNFYLDPPLTVSDR
jgi:peptide-methionine (S)-S-oxide reductase